MADTFDFQPQADEVPPYGEGLEHLLRPMPEYPPDNYLGVPHAFDINQPPVAIPHQLSQGSHATVPSLSSARDHPYCYGLPPAPVNWEFMQTPQPAYLAQSRAVCPTPTSLPSVPSLITGTNGGYYPPPFHPAHGHNQLLPLSCDHTGCYPPSDVPLLSRRFPENQLWIRARALAVASIPYRRRGSELI